MIPRISLSSALTPNKVDGLLEAFLEPRAVAAKRVTSAAAADQSAAGASQRRSASLSDIYPVAFQRPPSEIRPFLLSATIGFNQPMPNREGLRDG
jgi:hypothetical protein